MLWSQVNRYCKLLAPWRNLKHMNSKTERSLNLDYTSAFQPNAIYAAARAGDWAVFSSGLGSVLLKIIVRAD